MELKRDRNLVRPLVNASQEFARHRLYQLQRLALAYAVWNKVYPYCDNPELLEENDVPPQIKQICYTITKLVGKTLWSGFSVDNLIKFANGLEANPEAMTSARYINKKIARSVSGITPAFVKWGLGVKNIKKNMIKSNFSYGLNAISVTKENAPKTDSDGSATASPRAAQFGEGTEIWMIFQDKPKVIWIVGRKAEPFTNNRTAFKWVRENYPQVDITYRSNWANIVRDYNDAGEALN